MTLAGCCSCAAGGVRLDDVPESPTFGEILSCDFLVSDGSPTSSKPSCSQSSQLLKWVCLVTQSLVTAHCLAGIPGGRQVSPLSPLIQKSQILSWFCLSHVLGQQGIYPQGRIICSGGLGAFKGCDGRCPRHIWVILSLSFAFLCLVG